MSIYQFNKEEFKQEVISNVKKPVPQNHQHAI